MQGSSLISQPILRYQVDPLLNISPLIDLYADCLTHVVDTDGLFHLAAHRSPIILSFKRGIFNSNLSYQKSFAHVRSPRCLLTIAAYFISWEYNAETLREFIVPKSHKIQFTANTATKNFARIFPQFFIIMTNQSARSIDLNRRVNGRAHCYDDLPLMFALQLKEDLNNSVPNGIFGAAIMQGFDHLAFNCSAFKSCRNEMEQTIKVVARSFGASWRFYGSTETWSDGGNPFERGVQAGVEEAMESFVLGPKSQRSSFPGRCPPNFVQIQDGPLVQPKELIATGKTAVVKFITTAGVFTTRSSYRVYLSPFWPTVWLSMFLSAGMTVAAIIAVFKMQGVLTEVNIGMATLTAELAIWIFAATIGQYKHSRLPLISGRLRRKVIWIFAPVVVAWFILSTFLVNAYSAVFNSDATEPFYYLTNYTEFLQLPADVLPYILVNESYVRRYQEQNPSEDCRVEMDTDFCVFHKNVPAACTIASAIYTAYYRIGTDPNWKIAREYKRMQDKWMKIQNLRKKSSFLCANIDALGRVLLESEKPQAFLISDHDVQKCWKLFAKVMQKYPAVKVANNFNAEEPFLSKPVMYKFTSGLHPALKGSVVARMKILLSSGIYDLWQRWHHIRFTDGGLQHAEKTLPQENKVEPLTFYNSGTLWIFYAQTFFWLVATVICIFEMLSRVFADWYDRIITSRS